MLVSFERKMKALYKSNSKFHEKYQCDSFWRVGSQMHFFLCVITFVELAVSILLPFLWDNYMFKQYIIIMIMALSVKNKEKKEQEMKHKHTHTHTYMLHTHSKKEKKKPSKCHLLAKQHKQTGLLTTIAEYTSCMAFYMWKAHKCVYINVSNTHNINYS